MRTMITPSTHLQAASGTVVSVRGSVVGVGFDAQLGGWLKAGKVHYREEIMHGLEQAPAAFVGMLDGRNFGKCVNRIGPSK